VADPRKTQPSQGANALRRATRRVIRAVGLIVPRDHREDWIREWDAELWHYLSAPHRRAHPGRTVLPLAWRTIGSISHALWIRRNEWRT